MGRDGKQAGSITQQGAPYFTPTLSPDGDRLAVSSSGDAGKIGISLFDLRRGTWTLLTFENGAQHTPLWAPDGKTLFYGSNSGGISQISARAADGSGSVQTILASTDASEAPTSLSADGRYLIYDRRALTGTQTSHDLWILPLFGDGKPFPIVQTPFDDGNGVVAPNGKWMAYQNNESGHTEIYITAFPGGGAKWQVSTSGGISPHWRRNGKELFFLDPASNMMAVDVDESGSAVRLGVPHDVVGMLMPPILRLFRQDHPNVLVTLVSDTSRSLKQSLVQGEVDLTLLTEPQPGEGDLLLLSDRLVWVGAKGGDAHHRRPLPIALGQESCGFRAAAVQALTKARIEWRAICQVGSMEPVFATLEADMAIAPFLSKTVPERLAVFTGSHLPKLPTQFVNMRLPSTGVSALAIELARYIREGFQKRHGSS